MKAVLIDHDDSFTHNLRHWLKPLFQQVEVINHRDFFKSSSAIDHKTLVVLSPGPKSPNDYPQTLAWLKALPGDVPVYGVCLGLQLMAQISGVQVKAYSPPLHGKKSKLKILKKDFENLQQAEVARYHSLYCDFNSAQNIFDIIAVTNDEFLPMWIQHKNKKWMGVQFHPESFLTEQSSLHLEHLQNWLRR